MGICAERLLVLPQLRALPELTQATADCAFALLLAAARRIVECDAYARSPAFTTYDNLLLLGSSVHGSTLGIVGMVYFDGFMLYFHGQLGSAALDITGI